MAYEAVLLFGILFAAGLIFDVTTQSRHALVLRHARQLWLFFVLGVYFVYCWTHGGQTLPMKTWRIKLVAAENDQLTFFRAIARYLLAWIWFLPAMAIDYAFGLKAWVSIGIVVLGMILWATTARFSKSRQFLHDRLAGTRLIAVPKAEVGGTAEG
jgi:uncharacterized RDD family membrane protein YckC